MKRALVLYEQACDGGYATACVNLGIVHETGQGVAVDRSVARGFYQRGCEAGVREGCTSVERLDTAALHR